MFSPGFPLVQVYEPQGSWLCYERASGVPLSAGFPPRRTWCNSRSKSSSFTETRLVWRFTREVRSANSSLCPPSSHSEDLVLLDGRCPMGYHKVGDKPFILIFYPRGTAPYRSMNPVKFRTVNPQSLRILMALVCVLLVVFVGAAQLLHTHPGPDPSDPGCSLCAVAHLAAVFTPAHDSLLTAQMIEPVRPADPDFAPPHFCAFAHHVRPPPVLTTLS